MHQNIQIKHFFSVNVRKIRFFLFSFCVHFYVFDRDVERKGRETQGEDMQELAQTGMEPGPLR